MITGPEHGSDLKGRPASPAPTVGIDLPDAVHLEMGVQGEVVAEPEQLMLAAGDHFAYAKAGQIRCRQGRDTEFRSRQHAAGKYLIQSPACQPDGVSLRHGLIVPRPSTRPRSEEHTSELQSRQYL